jgi:transposase InsO family protein
MTIYGYVLPGAVGLACWAQKTKNISEKAKQKLKVIDWLRAHKGNASLAARHFGLTRKTVKKWRNSFSKFGILGLNDKSHRPKKLRTIVTSWLIISEIVKLRKKYPAWSKYKIARILKRDKSIVVSASTVGRILKKKGLIDKKKSKKKSKAAKHPRKRFPGGFKIHSEGDMVQMDTKHINLIGGRKIYQFTAIDVLTKRRVLKYYPSLASANGAAFLQHCIARLPFVIRNVQTDNGPEFLGDFEKLCKDLNLPHYFIEPRHPKQDTYVENSHGSDENEFYQQGNGYFATIEVAQKKLDEWEYTWNYIRPHEALGYLTPDEYSNKYKVEILPTKNVIVLQA